MGFYLYFLPPYSPELNRIEPVFRQVKHQEIPQRSHATRSGLREAVEAGFTNYARKLRPKSTRELLLLSRASERCNVFYRRCLHCVVIGL